MKYLSVLALAVAALADDTDYCSSTRPIMIAPDRALECSNQAGPQFSCPNGYFCDTAKASNTQQQGAQGFCCTYKDRSVCESKNSCGDCTAEGCSWVMSQCVPFCIPQTFVGACVTEASRCPTSATLPVEDGTCWRRCSSIGWGRQPYTLGTRPVYVYEQYPATTSANIPLPPGQYFPGVPANNGYPLNGYPVPAATYTYIGLPAAASKCSCDSKCTDQQDCCFDYNFYCV